MPSVEVDAAPGPISAGLGPAMPPSRAAEAQQVGAVGCPLVEWFTLISRRS
jgi:hypothetical protein